MGDRDCFALMPTMFDVNGEGYTMDESCIPYVPGNLFEELAWVCRVEFHSEVESMGIGASKLTTQSLAGVQPMLYKKYHRYKISM